MEDVKIGNVLVPAMGNVWLPSDLVDSINKHRDDVINSSSEDVKLILKDASFAIWFSDYMCKGLYK